MTAEPCSNGFVFSLYFDMAPPSREREETPGASPFSASGCFMRQRPAEGASLDQRAAMSIFVGRLVTYEKSGTLVRPKLREPSRERAAEEHEKALYPDAKRAGGTAGTGVQGCAGEGDAAKRNCTHSKCCFFWPHLAR